MERRGGPAAAGLPADARPGVVAGPRRRAGAAAPARPAGRPADQHRAHRLRWPGAAPLHRRPRPRAAPGLDHAGARVLLRGGDRRHQRHRDGAGVRRARPRVRPRALRGAPGGHGLRRGPDQGPGVRQDRRRDRPDLLAAGRRPADDLPRPVDRRADQPGSWRGEQQPRPEAAAGVHPGLPAHRRHRAGARPGRGHAERPREERPVTRRPGRADLAGHRGAGQAAGVRRRDGGPAERDGGADVLPAGGAGTAPRRRGAREADLGRRPGGRGARAAGADVAAWPGRPRRGMAAGLPRGGGGLRARRVADARGGERRRQAGPGPRRPPAAQPRRAVPRGGRRRRAATGWRRSARSWPTARGCWSSGTWTR